MRVPRSLYTIAPILLLATAAFAQDDLPDINTVEAPSGIQTSSEEPSSTPTPSSSTEATQTADATTGGNPFHLTDLPTISGALDPTIGVPYTANAPYMQKSSLPEGTVFIAVGAALGFLGAFVLAWRGLVAWSLHRSVKQDNVQNFPGESKASLGRGGMYSGLAGDSALSLNKPNLLKSKHLSAAPSSYSGTSGRAKSQLFFSPTAGAGNPSAARSSTYLPAGYYAAGNSGTPQSGPLNMGNNPSTLSLGLPTASGYNRARSTGPSPPGSPALPPSRGHDRPPPSRGSEFARTSVYHDNRARSQYGRPSTSSLNLNVAPEGRAPSAYLEDLFENHGNGPRERY